MLDLYYHACDEYKRCLRMPVTSVQRFHNDAYMAFLRDFIAAMESCDAEEAQARYEAAP